MLARQAAAAVGVGTCWPAETAATLPSARRRKALRRPRGEERGGAYRGGRLQLVKMHFEDTLKNTNRRVLAQTFTLAFA